MIKISRCACPKSLQGDKPSAYNTQSVVTTLHKMQLEKCCYCESFIPEKGHTKAVEHFHPKSVFGALEREWSNLMLACALCNGIKSDRFPFILSSSDEIDAVIYTRKTTPDERVLIDPTDEDDVDPLDHITFDLNTKSELLGLAIAKDGSERGQETIEITGIHRIFMTKRRRGHLHRVMRAHIEVLEELDHATLKRHIPELERKLDTLLSMGEPTRDYSAIAKIYIESSGIEKRVQAAIRELSD